MNILGFYRLSEPVLYLIHNKADLILYSLRCFIGAEAILLLILQQNIIRLILEKSPFFFFFFDMEGNDLKQNNAHLSRVMKANKGGFEKISLPALIFKCLYLALLHSITWKMLRRKKEEGNNGVD